MTIGERIRAVRQQKGMTQKQVADACNMADSAIRKYESGIQTPKIETLQRIADALGVTASSLRPPDLYWEDENGIGHTEPQHIDSEHTYLWDNMRQYRKAVGLTQKALSEKADVPLKMIRAYESDNSGYFIARAELERIAAVLQIQPETLLGDSVTAEWMQLTFQENCYRQVNEAMQKLNIAGQQEAVKRVEELTYIPRYRAKQAPQSTPPAQEGTDITPAETPPQRPQEGEE